MTAERVLDQTAASPDWMVAGRGFGEQHFSPLKQINDQNVNSLGVAWYLPIDSAMGMSSEPIEVDGTLYVTAALDIVYAVNASTGKQIWRFDPKAERGVSTQNSYAVRVNRGVAVWEGKVYVATGDCRLFAVDAASGRQLWASQVCDPKWTGSTGAPHVARGKVFIGYNGSDDESRGSIVAFDAQTGKEAYRFWTVPGDPALGPEPAALEMARKTWQGPEYWKVGGGDVWDAITYDPQTNLIVFGNAGAHAGEGTRQHQTPAGDKLYAGSIVAINADTGQYVWHYQTSGKYHQTENFHIIIADLVINGQKRHVAMTAPKNGFFYVLDATNGKLINGGPMVNTTWAHSLDLTTGRPVEVTPPAGRKENFQWTVHNWWPMSYSPDAGLVYVPITDSQDPHHASTPDFNTHPSGRSFFGRLIAWDPVKNEARWSVQEPIAVNGSPVSTAGNLVFQGEGTGEFSAYTADSGKKLWSVKTGSAIDSVPITYSAGGEQYVVVPIGWGSASRIFGPASMMVTMETKYGPSGLIAFKLGGTAALPNPHIVVPEVPKPPVQTFSKEDIAQGRILAESHLCEGCHSPHLDGSGAWTDQASGADGDIPDLRYMPESVHQQWYAIVMAGSHEKQGMLGFGVKDLEYPPVTKLTTKEADQIHAYIIDEEWKAYNAQHSTAKPEASAK
ncbi:PQQ-binding-like beta-propeller repeat protein [Paracidobacterium acidisoli]|uniref:outer membrane protein assembly factor BamB family protein n=1 Tax=Paracidobacterium acidisoli TaxID=2303751 RepID=UPI001C0236D1|nr:PQQ-binding-like beta-propeller repeat protein [Paracidobacterium acidisoli]